eukprot:Sspe_Gene.728::Locus_248_Transcript_1_1_Confidence_1.000_Length_365::g.728::m.728
MSRSWGCHEGVNRNCGAAVNCYSCQEGKDRYPHAGGAPDGKLASNGNRYPGLDEQTATRWEKVGMSAGWHEFVWDFVAPHRTAELPVLPDEAGVEPGMRLCRGGRSEERPFCGWTGKFKTP